MKSICLRCLLYTLKDKEVKDNLYLEIFYVWLGKLIQSGGLTTNDLLELVIDSRTCEYLENNNTPFPIFLDKLPCSFTIVVVEPPSNSLEGMMNKYLKTEYNNDVFIYCDIDILISNPFHTLLEKISDKGYYFCKEGALVDENYSGSYSTEVTNRSLPGFSAGKFVIAGKDLRDLFFDLINNSCDYSTQFYTVEQPFFNRAIYNLPFDTLSLDIDLLTEYVSFNGNEYDKNKTIFNDMAGDVADGKIHAIKIMAALSLYLAGVY
jgi:hypothetical protein